MGERILIEEGREQPSGYHYVVRRSGADTEDGRKAAELDLIRNGCTKIYHQIPKNPDASCASFGTVEPMAVVQQRIARITR